jgi:hypothetical protein
MIVWFTANYLAAFLEATLDFGDDEKGAAEDWNEIEIQAYLLRLVHDRSSVFLPMTIAGMYMIHVLDHRPKCPTSKQTMLLLATSISLNPLNQKLMEEEASRKAEFPDVQS